MGVSCKELYVIWQFLAIQRLPFALDSLNTKKLASIHVFLDQTTPAMAENCTHPRPPSHWDHSCSAGTRLVPTLVGPLMMRWMMVCSTHDSSTGGCQDRGRMRCS